VPPEVVARMELDPERYDKPKSAELAILFADIRGFTGICESLSPEALRDYIDEYLTAIGIGVNSGMVRMGDMDSRVRRAYTAMRHAVNVAPRLEGRTKTYGVGILVGEATRSRIQDVVFREIDRIRVKGKEEAIAIYEPLEKESAELESWGGGTARLPRAAMGTRHPPQPAAVRLGRHHEVRREIGRRLKCAFVCSVAREGSAGAICAQRPSFSTATF